MLLAGTGSDPSELSAAVPGSVITKPAEEGFWGKKSIGLSGKGVGVGAAYAKRVSLAETAVGRSSTRVRSSVSALEMPCMKARKYVSSTGGFARGKEKVGSRKGKKTAKNSKQTKRKDVFTKKNRATIGKVTTGVGQDREKDLKWGA